MCLGDQPSAPILARLSDDATAVDPRVSHPQKFVWSQEDIRKGKQDELAQQRFFDHAKNLPRLPRRAYDIQHDITLTPSQSFDSRSQNWTTTDVMMVARQYEIASYALQLRTQPMSGEEIAEVRTRVAQVADAYAQAPTEVDAVDSAFVAAVRPPSRSRPIYRHKKNAVHDDNVEAGVEDNANNSSPSEETNQHLSPAVERIHQASVKSGGRTFKRFTPDRLADFDR